MVDHTVRDALREVAAARGWDKSQTPDNLAKSICIEAAELLECYQWSPDRADPTEVKYELADVLTYCFRLADLLELDPDQIVLDKLEITKKKYPTLAEQAAGKAKKNESEKNDAEK